MKRTMARFYQPDLSTDLDSPFVRDGEDKLIRRSYWLDMDDRTLVMVMVNGIGAMLCFFVPANGLLVSIDFLKELLELAKEVVKLEREIPLEEEINRGKAALTELFEQAKNGNTPIMVKRVVDDIDEIVRAVRFDGWQNTHGRTRGQETCPASCDRLLSRQARARATAARAYRVAARASAGMRTHPS